MKKMKEKNIRKNRQVIETNIKGNETPRTRQDLEDFITLKNNNDEKLKNLSMNPYGDDLL